MYVEKLNFIPQVPPELILSVDEAMENHCIHRDPYNIYGSYLTNDSLAEWIQSYYDYEVESRYQIITTNLPLHIDHGIVGTKANYLIKTGGDNVVTQWYNDLKNPTELLHEEKCQANTWYNINIEVPHAVYNVTRLRYSITVRRELLPDGTWKD